MNMSYCRFRNTLPDLQDCMEALDEGFLDHSENIEELEAAARLIRLCSEIARFYGEDDEE